MLELLLEYNKCLGLLQVLGNWAQDINLENVGHFWHFVSPLLEIGPLKLRYIFFFFFLEKSGDAGHINRLKSRSI